MDLERWKHKEAIGVAREGEVLFTLGFRGISIQGEDRECWGFSPFRLAASGSKPGSDLAVSRTGLGLLSNP